MSQFLSQVLTAMSLGPVLLGALVYTDSQGWSNLGEHNEGA